MSQLTGVDVARLALGQGLSIQNAIMAVAWAGQGKWLAAGKFALGVLGHAPQRIVGVMVRADEVGRQVVALAEVEELRKPGVGPRSTSPHAQSLPTHGRIVRDRWENSRAKKGSQRCCSFGEAPPICDEAGRAAIAYAWGLAEPWGCWVPGLAGAVIIEATKQLYGAKPVKAQRRGKPVLVPLHNVATGRIVPLRRDRPRGILV